MSLTVAVNPGQAGLTLCHKGSNGISIADVPDVCNTPPTPTPVPYANVAFSGDLVRGTKTITADGGNMCANFGSAFSKSTGDEAGSAGGTQSATFMKEATWVTHSFDVKLEGKGACRLTDKMFHNCQNTMNSIGEQQKPLLAAGPCSAETLVSNVKKCDGGAGMWGKATKGLGREPKVVVQTPKTMAGIPWTGQIYLDTGTISITPAVDCCTATQILIFELGNASQRSKFAEIARKAKNGDLSRKEYIEANEYTEMDNLPDCINAFDNCSTSWGCGPAAISRYAHSKGLSKEDILKHTSESHKEHYGLMWDKHYKSAYGSKPNLEHF